MKKTLYITDLDGTLLRSDARLSEESCAILNRLIGAGMLFTYATARSIYSARKVTEGLTQEMPRILYNGAMIREGADARLADMVGLEPGEAREIVDFCLANGTPPIVYAMLGGRERCSYAPTSAAEELAFIASRGNDPRMRAAGEDGLGDGEIFYLTLIGTDETLKPVYERFGERDSLQCIWQRDIYSGNRWLEIMNSGATKAAALGRLRERLRCERVVAFGDGVNDIPMFLAADESYATENAPAVVKKVAAGVIGSNDEDSVAKWIERDYRSRN